ncbi:helix-turn-helix domain-containing protein [Streptomyces sp. 4F14]|uniref:helix-turn-helix domain-containing protein n=1 Tax=Streptomyces sp. 4F14 TaxID=3394380 RepID=UPI003A8AC1DF
MRGLHLLTFRSGEDSLRLSGLAQRAGLPVSTAHRLVGELELCGLLERRGVELLLGPGLVQPVRQVWRLCREDARPHLLALHRATGRDIALTATREGRLITMCRVARRSGTTVISYHPHGTRAGQDGLTVAVRPPGTRVEAGVVLVGAGRADEPRLYEAAARIEACLTTRILRQPSGRQPAPEPASMLARGVHLLGAVRVGEAPVPFTELARRACLPRSTAHRLITTLTACGFLDEARSPAGGGYVRGPA